MIDWRYSLPGETGVLRNHDAGHRACREHSAGRGRIRERGLSYWADPFKRKGGQINTWDDGRGVYFEDPNGHLLEILTRPYGSKGTSAEYPHPLMAETLEPEKARGTAESKPRPVSEAR